MKKISFLIALLICCVSSIGQTIAVNASVSGRNAKMSTLKVPEYSIQGNGIVVIDIMVNREGIVRSATPNMDDTTIDDPVLIDSAKQAALAVKFDAKENASVLQDGIIIYAYSEERYQSEDTSGNVSVESSNPLAGSNLPSGFSLIDEPRDFNGVKKYKILQVIAADAALARSQDTQYRSMELFGNPIVLLISEEGNEYYDDLVVSCPSNKKVKQLGTYRYETNGGMSKTVPILMFMK